MSEGIAARRNYLTAIASSSFDLCKQHTTPPPSPAGGSMLRNTARQRGKQAKLAQALRRPSTLVDSALLYSRCTLGVL